MENGGTETGGIENGGAENGGIENGGAENGGIENGTGSHDQENGDTTEGLYRVSSLVKEPHLMMMGRLLLGWRES